MARVYLGGMFHEANSFSTLATELDNFTIVAGDDLAAKLASSNTGLAAAAQLLWSRGHELVHGFSAVAAPGGPITDNAYQELKRRFLMEIGVCEPDAVYLDLHGAMMSTSLDDMEGDLLSAIRATVGADIPIAADLDLHGHVTPRMLEKADILIACKENPHTDYDLAGAKASGLLHDMLTSRAAIVSSAAWVPLLVGAGLETASDPLRKIHARARKLESENARIHDISIFNTTSLVDAAHTGQCVTIMHAPEQKRAVSHALEQLSGLIWESRHDFSPNFVALPEILRRIRQSSANEPVIVGDQGDRVLAGAPGDGTYIARVMVEQARDVRAVIPMTDPDTVDAARVAGEGAILERAIGGGLSRGTQSLEAAWAVNRLGDGEFINKGPFMANEPSSLGPTAVLQSNNLTVLATSKPGFTQDPAAFESQGVRLNDFDLVVTKSGYHFKLSFADVGPCIVADTPGVSNYVAGTLPFRKRTDVYPENDEIGARDIRYWRKSTA
ncbi:M81 family metallopeptidase [Hoeflea poritis]|uniref:M81 family metallopeptidase n=1 Tax=Hoeflea poritis TaxID=2993659 RepID=A0ABT4VSZ0_9HYPH|nr:M81 family metallopeptidase [Hoeflea poritis]MDA4847833.1 M81 family metallopeptidase [Hoeflea poritis]